MAVTSKIFGHICDAGMIAGVELENAASGGYRAGHLARQERLNRIRKERHRPSASRRRRAINEGALRRSLYHDDLATLTCTVKEVCPFLHHSCSGFQIESMVVSG